jgi:hypothetical protein
MALLENEFARRDPQGIELRPTPARLAWRLDGLNSSDDHELRVRFVASAQVPDDPTDRRLFAETLLTKLGPLTLDTVSECFRAALTNTARDLLRERPVQHWIDPDSEKSLCETLARTAQRVGFSHGLQVLPPFTCEVRSPSFERSQRAAQQVALQTQTLARATQLLQQFNALRSASPDQTAGQLLSHLSPTEQSEMLTAVLAGGQATSNQQLFAVSGTSLLKIDPRSNAPPQILLVSDAIGPFRSISIADDCLLVGGQRGIVEVDPDSSQIRATYPAPVTSDFGFNAAIKLGDVLYATHVEAGLLAWRENEPETLFRSFVPTPGEIRSTVGASIAYSNASIRSGGGVSGPRYLVKANQGAAVFAVGASLHVLSDQSVRPLESTRTSDVIALLAMDSHILVVRKDGNCTHVDRETFEIEDTFSPPRDLRAAALLPWMSSQRLIVADNSGAVDCIGVEDSAVVRFHSPNMEMRMLAASEDRIAGVASDRQRVQIWTLTNPHAPAREVHIASLTRHRVAAIAFA